MGCVFCGSEVNRTDEHVFAEWQRKALNVTTGKTTLWDGDKVAKTESGVNIVLKDGVCQRCNNEWLSRLETDAQRWLTAGMVGQHMALPTSVHPKLAAWAVGKALLLQLTVRRKFPAQARPIWIPESNVRWLYDHHDEPVPPPGAHVWLGRIEPYFGTETATATRFRFSMSPPEDPHDYLTVFTAGYLVFLVICQDVTPELTTRDGMPPFDYMLPDKWITSLVALWPQRQDMVIWPPSHTLSPDDYERLSQWEGLAGRQRHWLHDIQKVGGDGS